MGVRSAGLCGVVVCKLCDEASSKRNGGTASCGEVAASAAAPAVASAALDAAFCAGCASGSVESAALRDCDCGCGGCND